MSIEDKISDALRDFARTENVGPYLAIPTQCLYPSNKSVTVYVSGGEHSCVVSDNGGAVDEITGAGFEIPYVHGFLSQFCRPRGLMESKGQILSPPMPTEDVAAGIVAVANASSEAATWGMHNLKPRRKRNLMAELSALLGRLFVPEHILAREAITGASNRRYHIDYAVRMPLDHLLLIDTVLPEASSINAKVVAHLDIQRTQNSRYESLLTYDDEDEWKASDLGLLRTAARLVPISALDVQLTRGINN